MEGPSSAYSYAAPPALHKPAVKTAVQCFGVVVPSGRNHSVSILSDFHAGIDIDPDISTAGLLNIIQLSMQH